MRFRGLPAADQLNDMPCAAVRRIGGPGGIRTHNLHLAKVLRSHCATGPYVALFLFWQRVTGKLTNDLAERAPGCVLRLPPRLPLTRPEQCASRYPAYLRWQLAHKARRPRA